MAKRTPKPVDVAVGLRVKFARTEAGRSQEWLGEAVGLTYQQIQKYENGTNRIGSSRLVQIATALKKPPSYFFNEQANGRADHVEADLVMRMLVAPGGMALAQSYLAIKDRRHQITVAQVAAALAS